MKTRWIPAALISASLVLTPALGMAAENECPGGATNQGAMWLSIAHPGLGEAQIEGGNWWKALPKNKFFFGFIPFFGWPGYLQVKSAIDASNCKTNDEMFRWE